MKRLHTILISVALCINSYAEEVITNPLESDTALCKQYGTTKDDKFRKEINKRGLISFEEWMLIATNIISAGMTECAIFAIGNCKVDGEREGITKLICDDGKRINMIEGLVTHSPSENTVFKYQTGDQLPKCVSILEERIKYYCRNDCLEAEDTTVASYLSCSNQLGQYLRKKWKSGDNKELLKHNLLSLILRMRPNNAGYWYRNALWLDWIGDNNGALLSMNRAMSLGYQRINTGLLGVLNYKAGYLEVACEWLSKSGHGEDNVKYYNYGCNSVEK